LTGQTNKPKQHCCIHSADPIGMTLKESWGYKFPSYPKLT